jgi:hypothetical protein
MIYEAAEEQRSYRSICSFNCVFFICQPVTSVLLNSCTLHGVSGSEQVRLDPQHDKKGLIHDFKWTPSSFGFDVSGKDNKLRIGYHLPLLPEVALNDWPLTPTPVVGNLSIDRIRTP